MISQERRTQPLRSFLLLAAVISSAVCRDVVLPPQIPETLPLPVPTYAELIHQQSNPSTWPEIVFSGLTTFAHLPWTHCLADSQHSEIPDASTLRSSAQDPLSHDSRDNGQTSLPVAKYDVAILGAPFDSGTTSRPGARSGPSGIRRGSQRIAPHGAWNAYTRTNPLMSWAKVIDCGDAPLTVTNGTLALMQLQQAHDIVSRRIAHSAGQKDKPSVPRTIVLGGDHTTTLAALRVAYKHWGKMSVIHFDSHLDTWDPNAVGGGIGTFGGLNHGTFLHFAHEEGLLTDDTNIHAGIRAPVANKRYDWEHDKTCGFDIVTARDIDYEGVKGVVQRLKERVGDSNVYISVDIDVLDPAYAPGTGTAEVGGWTTRELLSIIDGLAGLNVVGGDVVEVSPIYDNAGETTVLAAAEVVMSLIRLMVVKPVKALVDVEQQK